MTKTLIYVQHLLGTGHAVRAVALGRQLRLRGHDVVLVPGNRLPGTLEVGDMTVRPLPPARSRDATFSELVDDRDMPIDDPWRARRSALLLKILHEQAPDILVTETFPLGRRQFAFELLPLLEAAASLPRKPVIACSVRDILVPKADKRKELWMAEIANRFYDLVMVHADPAVVRLQHSFAFTERIEHLVHYTGYVHERRPAAGGEDGTDEVVVSSGGGPVGMALLEAAIEARGRSRRAGDTCWRLLVSPSHGETSLARLRDRATDGIVVEPARPDFQSLLGRARLSVSQAGYNTVLDVLAARCRAVLVPFEQENETEQRSRARLLAERGLATVIGERSLSGSTLAEAVDRAMAATPPAAPAIGLDGAAVAADLMIAAAAHRGPA